MRQFLTMRFWMTIVALLALTLLVYVATRSDPRSDQVIAAPSAPTERHIDFVAQVSSVNAGGGFAMAHGRSQGQLQLVIDGTRTMVVQPDTPGEVTCANLSQPGQCVVAADLLGDAVLWFAVIPAEPRPSVTLPGIVQLRDDNVVELSNGWLLDRASTVDLNCTDDVTSLTDFVSKYKQSSTTTFSLDTQQIVRATCNESPETTTTSAVPATPPPVPVGVVDTTLVPDSPNASNSGIG